MKKPLHILISGRGSIDATSIQPLIDHPYFQLLGFIRQLGISHFRFRSANHTRFEHSIVTYHLTCKRTARWREAGIITPQQARNIDLFGLLHDIGHRAYSHELDELCDVDHNAYGLSLLHELKSHIEACGGDFAGVEALFKRADPLSGAVSHHPLGTDKLAYVAYDAQQTGNDVAIPEDALLNYTYFREGEMVIENSIISEVMMAQEAYEYMYERVYLRSKNLIAKRFLAKMVAELFTYPAAQPELTQAELRHLVDSQLDALLFSSKNPLVRDMHRRLLSGQLPKVALIIKPKGLAAWERRSGKSVFVTECAPELLPHFDRFRRQIEARKLEIELAKLADIPPEAMLFIPVSSAERFVASDITVFDGERRVGTLRELKPAHYASLEETAQDFMTVRVCVLPEYREKIAAPATAQRLSDFLLSQVA